MNDNQSEFERWIDPEIEARVVAWVLGEASPFEAAELERMVIERPELAVFKRRIEAVHGLVSAAESPAHGALQLSAERRRKVLETLGAPTPPLPKTTVPLNVSRDFSPRQTPGWLIFVGVAACVIVGFFLASSVVVFKLGKSEPPDFEGLAVAPPSAPEPQAPLTDDSFHAPTDEAVALGYSRSAAEETTKALVAEASSMLAPAKPEENAPLELAKAQADRPVAMPAVTASESSERDRSQDSAIGQPVFGKDGEFGGFINYGSPIIDTRSGQATSAQVVREFEYPSEFNPAATPVASAAVTAKQKTLEEKRVAQRADVAMSANAMSDNLSSARQAPSAPAAAGATSDEFRESEVAGAAGSRRGGSGGGITSSLAAASPAAPSAGVPSPDYALGITRDAAAAPVQPPVQSGVLGSESPRDASAPSPSTGPLASSAPGSGAAGGGWAEPRSREFTAGATELATDRAALVAGNKKGQDQIAVDELRRKDNVIFHKAGEAQIPLEGANTFSGGTVVTADATKALADGMPGLAKSDKDTRLESELEVLGDIPLQGSLKKSEGSDRKNAFKEKTVVGGTIQNPEIPAAREPLSTFSLHVADVSFRLAQAALERGQMPEPSSIRAEEFYNAFDYGDPSPRSGEEVACRIEQAAHPFLQQRNLVRISMKVAATGRTASQPLRLIVLLDTSGSMEREDRAASVRRAFSVLASLLGPEDRITLVGFARRPRILADNLPGNQAGGLADLVARTPSEGGTNIEEALKLAGELATRKHSRTAQNRIVLLTDGGANLGNASPEQLSAKIQELRQKGIAFDACGVGAEGVKDEVLEALTRKGDGRYYLLDRPENADAGFARQLAGALRPAALDVKVQVRFNPARVRSYRLIGFEKHQLRPEDFRNDRVDAAELSAEEAAVALYQVELLPAGEGELGEVSVRFRNPVNRAVLERSWTMSYDAEARPFDQASPSMQLAGLATFVAEKLRGGQAAESIDLNALAPVAARVREAYPQQDHVREFLAMFEKLRRMK